MSSASSITSRLRRPRKSILSSPICSIGFIENCVTMRKARSPLSSVPASASCSGTMSVSGRSAITTAAAWIEELRTIPSRPRATSTICARVGVLVARLAQRLALLQAVLERRRAAHDRVGDQLRQAVAGARSRSRAHAPRRAWPRAGTSCRTSRSARPTRGRTSRSRSASRARARAPRSRCRCPASTRARGSGSARTTGRSGAGPRP